MIVKVTEIQETNLFDCDALCGERGASISLETESGESLAVYCGTCNETSSLKVGEKLILTR